MLNQEKDTMNAKLENKFKTRLEKEVYMDPETVKKIKTLRKNAFDDINDYVESIAFPQVKQKLIKQCTAFDRKTEIKQGKHVIELFINIDWREFKIEKHDNYIYKIKYGKHYLTPKFVFEQIIMESLENVEYDAHKKTVKKTEDNITLNIVPCIYIPGEYYLLPNEDTDWRELIIEEYGRISNARIKERIFILKHWAQCQGFHDRQLDYFIESSVIKYYYENTSSECLYLDFNDLLKHIHENRDGFGKKKNDFGEIFAAALRKSIEISERMIVHDEEISIKCFEKIFGR